MPNPRSQNGNPGYHHMNMLASTAGKFALGLLYSPRKASVGALFLLAAAAFGQTYYLTPPVQFVAGLPVFDGGCMYAPITGSTSTPNVNVSFSVSCSNTGASASEIGRAHV